MPASYPWARHVATPVSTIIPVRPRAASDTPRTHAQQISRVAALSTVAIALVTLLGWVTSIPALTSMIPARIPMNPITALSFITVAIAVSRLGHSDPASARIARALAAVVVVLPLLCLSRLYLPWDLGPDRLLFMKSLAVPVAGFVNRMAPVTALGFVFTGAALILLTLPSTGARRAGSIAAMIVGLIGLAVVVDYFYESRTLAALNGFIPVAFNTAIAFLLTSVGLLAARPTEGVTLLFRNSGVGSAMARRLLPAAVIIPMTVGWLELRGADLGWYDAAGGSALVAITTAAVLIGLVWRNALSVNRAEEARNRAESDLRELNQTLEVQVELRTRALGQSNDELSIEVAAKRHAEEELRRAADEVRGLFEASPLAICSLSADDIVLSWNRAAEQLFGWQASDVIGKPLPIVNDRFRPEAADLTARVLAGKAVTDYETQRSCRDGSLREVSVSTAALYGADGAPCGLVAVYTDISNRKQLERQLRQSQKMDAIGQLAGGVAHDFNNILTVIQASAEFLMEGLDAEDVRRTDAVEIHSAAQRAARLTRQLLTFSRQGAVELQDLQVSGVVDRLQSMLQRLLPANVELLIQHRPGQGLVNADANQLEQIFVNLVVNARDAMPGGGTILIETMATQLDEHYTSDHAGMAPGPYIMLTVTDTGVGMSLHTRGRIFEPFFTTKAPGDGTGLGLATVYGIVKQFGGHIWVYSELGRGTTFKVYLPEVWPAVGTTAAAAPEAATVATHGARILLVEDYDIVRRAVHAQLVRQGYVVTDAKNADDALTLLGVCASGFDLVLSDMMMPGLSGLELRHQLRAQGVDIPVLLMSGYSENAIKRFGSVDELAPHIEKPFTTALLVTRIEELIRSVCHPGVS